MFFIVEYPSGEFLSLTREQVTLFTDADPGALPIFEDRMSGGDLVQSHRRDHYVGKVYRARQPDTSLRPCPLETK